MKQENIPQDTYFLPVDTAFGKAGFLYGEKPFRLIRSVLPGMEPPVSFKGLPKGPGAAQKPPEMALTLAKAMQAYFQGHPLEAPWKLLDTHGLTPLQCDVLAIVAGIPFGETRCYEDVARLLGRPGASRFIGSTMAKNPFPVFIPCHRVIKKDGSPGMFGGGIGLKARMLGLESGRG